MQSAKQEAIKILQTLPDDSTFEEIQYRLFVRQKIEQGLEDISQGKTYSQEIVEKRMEKWVESRVGTRSSGRPRRRCRIYPS